MLAQPLAEWYYKEKGGKFMRDFPFFTTEYGIASLVLKEIPYRQTAYIHIREAQPEFFGALLHECISFCRMAGAERIFAAGHEALEAYPLYTAVLEMRGPAEPDPEKVRHLFPVTKETVAQWRDRYNRTMAGVDNAGTLESRDEKRILESGGAYFVHEEGQILGIGWLEENRLLAVAAVQKGAGERVMHTLMTLAGGDSLVLEVASTNSKALRLYEKLGFLNTAEIARWYTIQ